MFSRQISSLLKNRLKCFHPVDCESIMGAIWSPGKGHLNGSQMALSVGQMNSSEESLLSQNKAACPAQKISVYLVEPFLLP